MDEKNQEQPIYSFWAEQIEASSPLHEEPAANMPWQDLTAQHSVKPGTSTKWMQRTFAALLFGLIASASFIGFNKLYYHYYPLAEPAALFGSGSAELELEPPEGKAVIAVAETSDNVSYTQETDISDIIEKTQPATVSIQSTIQQEIYDFFGRPYVEEGVGEGSGIIIGENDTEYLIATNSHVVSDASAIKVFLIDNTEVDALLKGKDDNADLAVVAISKADLSEETVAAITIAEIGDSDEVKVGQMVIAIGNALGYGQSVTVGYISAKDRVISNIDTDTTMTVIQVDAAINPGNSGGALLNAEGKVIGINSAKLADVKVEGIGYAIPITNAFPIVKDLMDRETLLEEDKGYLGIFMDSMTDVTPDITAQFNWPEGVYIREMTEGSAAEKAGLMTGDIIIAVDDTVITTKNALRDKVTSYRYGTVVDVKIMRYTGQEFEEMIIPVTLAKASQQ